MLCGLGEVHIDVVCAKLKNKTGVEAQVQDPKIAYRETIRATAEAEGKQRPKAERIQSIYQGQAIGSDPLEDIAAESRHLLETVWEFGGGGPARDFRDPGRRSCGSISGILTRMIDAPGREKTRRTDPPGFPDRL